MSEKTQIKHRLRKLRIAQLCLQIVLFLVVDNTHDSDDDLVRAIEFEISKFTVDLGGKIDDLVKELNKLKEK